MTDRTSIESLRPPGLVDSPVFAHGAVVPPSATTIFVGGENSVDETGQLIGAGDVSAQTTQTMEHLRAALAAAGASVHDIVLLSVQLVAGADLGSAYPAAAEALAGATPPVTVSMVSALAVPGALIEVSAIAAVIR